VSSAVLATVTAAFFHTPSSHFILFVTLVLPVVLLIASFNINLLPERMISFSYEISGGWSYSLMPYIHHLLLVTACILGVGACQHFLELSTAISIALGVLLCAAIISILVIPSVNKGPRSIIVTCDEMTSTHFSANYQELSLDGSSGYSSEHTAMPDSPTTSPVRTTYDSCPTGSPSTGDIELHHLSSPNSASSSPAGSSRRRSSLESLEVAFSYSDVDDEVIECELDCASNDFDDLYNGACDEHFISFHGRHVPLSESLYTWRLYVIMVVFCVVAGSGLLVINNIQAIAGAVNRQPSAFFVTIISLANAGGRVLIGMAADASADFFSRFQLQALIAVLMAVTQLVLSFGSSGLLYPSLLLTGAMFGATFSNIAAITSDVYGSHYVGSNYGFIDLAPSIGSYIFSAGLVAMFYPKSHDHDDLGGAESMSEGGGEEGGDMCKGVRCFRGAFLITAGACVLAALLAMFLHIFTPIRKT